MKHITSLDNQKIKDSIKLKKSSERKKTGLVFVDGFREIFTALESGGEVKELFYCQELDRVNNLKKIKIDQKLIFEVSGVVLNKMSYKENPDGFLAIIKPKKAEINSIKNKKNHLIVVLENIEKPGNLGAIIRTSYAAGVDLIIVNDNQTDIYNPNVIRASEGLVFKQEIVKASFSETISWLKKNKVIAHAAATIGKDNYTQVDMKKSLAIVLGSESEGLSASWLKAADKIIKIPMTKGVDSLNVSVSGAILIYEAVRQRNN